MGTWQDDDAALMLCFCCRHLLDPCAMRLATNRAACHRCRLLGGILALCGKKNEKHAKLELSWRTKPPPPLPTGPCTKRFLEHHQQPRQSSALARQRQRRCGTAIPGVMYPYGVFSGKNHLNSAGEWSWIYPNVQLDKDNFHFSVFSCLSRPIDYFTVLYLRVPFLYI